MAASVRVAMIEQLNEMSREQDRLRTRLNGLQGRPATEDELLAMRETQQRYDDVFRELGMPGAPGPLGNESGAGYRRRLLGNLAQFSARWRDAKISVLPSSAIDPIERQVFDDAARVAKNPAQGDFRHPGQLRRVDHTIDGIKVTDWRGDPGAWLGQFTSKTNLVVDMETGHRLSSVDLPGVRRR